MRESVYACACMHVPLRLVRFRVRVCVCVCVCTQVAVARDGTFYVADGYCNTRVAKFNADGTYIGECRHEPTRTEAYTHN